MASTKKIICLYGGPGSGKSTAAAGVFHQLKSQHFDCELNREYIKDWVWEGREVRPGDQTYIFAKSARKERVFIQQGLDFIITDSPLILTHFYGLKYDQFERDYNTSRVMLEHHHGFCKHHDYSVEHYFINRTKPFNQNGRNENEEQAKEIDAELRLFLNDFGIKYKTTNSEDAVDFIVGDLLNE